MPCSTVLSCWIVTDAFLTAGLWVFTVISNLCFPFPYWKSDLLVLGKVFRTVYELYSPGHNFAPSCALFSWGSSSQFLYGNIQVNKCCRNYFQDLIFFPKQTAFNYIGDLFISCLSITCGLLLSWVAAHRCARRADFMSILLSDGEIICQEKELRLPYRAQNKTIYVSKTVSLHRPFAWTLDQTSSQSCNRLSLLLQFCASDWVRGNWEIVTFRAPWFGR